MDPHSFEHDGERYDVQFERTAEGWIGRVRCEGSEAVQVIAFPDGSGYDRDDVRGSLIAGCESIVARTPATPPTRH